MRISDWSSDVCSSDLVLQPGDHLQQRRLAGAVAPDQAGALAGGQRQREPAEQRGRAEGKARVLEGNEGRSSSEARRVGTEGVRMCRSRWSPSHEKKTNIRHDIIRSILKQRTSHTN